MNPFEDFCCIILAYSFPLFYPFIELKSLERSCTPKGEALCWLELVGKNGDVLSLGRGCIVKSSTQARLQTKRLNLELQPN